jgi:hypothetical protein
MEIASPKLVDSLEAATLVFILKVLKIKEG